MRQQQEQVLREQDDLLAQLGSGVDRLHQQAVDIGDEANLQVNLLNDFDNDVDRAAGALQREARHAEKIREQSQNCWMYICIFVLLAILVFLLVFGLS